MGDRHITNESQDPQRTNRVLAILRQMQDLRFSDFRDMAGHFNIQADELHLRIEQSIKKERQK